MEWAVASDGRVKEHQLKPRRLRGGPFEKCIGEAFARFRYPSYRGEMQHIGLNFHVGD